jgi:putative DNA primase/helicase
MKEQSAVVHRTHTLRQLWDGDLQSIQCLQQWFGYLLTSETYLQKGLMLIGPPRGGKGVITGVLGQLLGEANVASTSFATLGNRFGLENLLDKTLVVIPDARQKRFSDEGVAAERLLNIIGGDVVPIDRKGMPIISRRLPLRIMLVSNEAPRLEDTSGALASRFVTLQLQKSWLGKEDPGLLGRLLAELPAIFQWAVEGWRDLQKEGSLLQPDSGRELGEELKNLGSPTLRFVTERCVQHPDRWTKTEDLYKAWQQWAK